MHAQSANSTDDKFEIQMQEAAERPGVREALEVFARLQQLDNVKISPSTTVTRYATSTNG